MAHHLNVSPSLERKFRNNSHSYSGAHAPDILQCDFCKAAQYHPGRISCVKNLLATRPHFSSMLSKGPSAAFRKRRPDVARQNVASARCFFVRAWQTKMLVFGRAARESDMPMSVANRLSSEDGAQGTPPSCESKSYATMISTLWQVLFLLLLLLHLLLPVPRFPQLSIHHDVHSAQYPRLTASTQAAPAWASGTLWLMKPGVWIMRPGMLSKLILGNPFLDVMTEILSISGSRAVSKDFTLSLNLEATRGAQNYKVWPECCKHVVSTLWARPLC